MSTVGSGTTNGTPTPLRRPTASTRPPAERSPLDAAWWAAEQAHEALLSRALGRLDALLPQAASDEAARLFDRAIAAARAAERALVEKEAGDA